MNYEILRLDEKAVADFGRLRVELLEELGEFTRETISHNIRFVYIISWKLIPEIFRMKVCSGKKTQIQNWNFTGFHLKDCKILKFIHPTPLNL